MGGVILGVGLVLVVGSLIGGGSEQSSPQQTPAEQRSALARYEKAIQPLIDNGAQLVALGLRPGVKDIADSAFDKKTLVRMSRSWVTQATRLRRRFAAVDTPKFLRPVGQLLERSVAAYEETAKALRSAALADSRERDEHLARVSELGPRADRLYDKAMETLDAHRRRLGMVSTSTAG